MPIDGCPLVPRQRLPIAWIPSPLAQAGGKGRIARRIGLGVAGGVGLGLTAIAAQKIGLDKVVASIVRSDLKWVLLATALMMALPVPSRRLLARDRPGGAAAQTAFAAAT